MKKSAEILYYWRITILMKKYLLILLAFFALSFSLFRPSEVKEEDPSWAVEKQAIEEIDTEDIAVEKDNPVQAIQQASIFGIPTSGYSIHADFIQKNQFLSDILGACNIDYSVVDKLVRKAKGTFDLRNMKANRPYTVLCSEDDTEKAEFLIYEHDPVQYVVFDLRDSLNIEIVDKEITTLTKTASGVINSSLYQTMKDQGLSPLLVVKLADVYAWSIDFFHIQKGDKFKLIYEERYADGEFIGIGEVKAGLFNHFGEDYYAINFEHPKLEFNDFYDDNAKSLRKAFLKAPLNYSRISSRFSSSRFHPVLKRRKAHLGTDYAAAKGTPIMSTANGTISKASYTRGNGNYVKVKHNSVYSTQYLHMSKIAKGIKPGVHVKQGQVIGYVGSTGLATGPHVCYRFWKNGKQVDPYKQKLPEAEAMKPELLPDFYLFSDSVKCRIDAIPYILPEDEQKYEDHEIDLQS